MRNYRTGRGPFAERPYYEAEEIEQLCAQELTTTGLYPSAPEAIRIERFIEKRFEITPEYDDLPSGVLGFTRFGPKGVEGIVVARDLAEERGKLSERRVNTTLAHEAGHGLLHAHLFALQESPGHLFGSDFDPKAPKIMCRDVISHEDRKAYDGRWWEFQANQVIGALLLPRPLVTQCLSPLLTATGSFGLPTLRPEKTKPAIQLLVETFNVNSAVAQIRLEQVFPKNDDRQLTL